MRPPVHQIGEMARNHQEFGFVFKHSFLLQQFSVNFWASRVGSLSVDCWLSVYIFVVPPHAFSTGFLDPQLAIQFCLFGSDACG